jgi:hypothetical protein
MGMPHFNTYLEVPPFLIHNLILLVATGTFCIWIQVNPSFLLTCGSCIFSVLAESDSTSLSFNSDVDVIISYQHCGSNNFVIFLSVSVGDGSSGVVFTLVKPPDGLDLRIDTDESCTWFSLIHIVLLYSRDNLRGHRAVDSGFERYRARDNYILNTV